MMDFWERISALEQAVQELNSRTMNAASRGTLMENNDAAGLQQMKVLGHYDEQFESVQRWEQYGITSVAPPGADALILSLNGSRDMAQIVSISDPRLRPKGSPEGSTTVYDSAGSKIILDAAGNITIECAGDFTVKAGGETVFTSSKQTHNGINVGDTHKHQDVVPGPSLTGMPT